MPKTMNKSGSQPDSISNLRLHLVYWQRQLRLDHWDIELRFAGTDEIEGQGKSAVTVFHKARILLCPQVDRSPSLKTIFRLDYEVVIVHELLHILESVWRDNPNVRDVMDEDEWIRQLHENSLDATAEALVRVRRGLER